MIDLAALVHQYGALWVLAGRWNSYRAPQLKILQAMKTFLCLLDWTLWPVLKRGSETKPKWWVNSLPMSGSLSQSYRKTDRDPPFIKPSLRWREGNSFIIIIIIIISICELYKILGFSVIFFIHAYSVTESNGHFPWSSVLPTLPPWPTLLEREFSL